MSWYVVVIYSWYHPIWAQSFEHFEPCIYVVAEGHLVDLGVTGLIYYVVGKLLAAPLPPTG